MKLHSEPEYKSISIIIQIPKDYKWIARQPFGTITAFKDKPVIVTDTSEDPPASYWEIQVDEMELGTGEQGNNWENSLIRI